MKSKPQLSAKLEKKLRSIIQKNTQSDGQGYGFEGEEEVVALFATALEEQKESIAKKLLVKGSVMIPIKERKKILVDGCDYIDVSEWINRHIEAILNGDKV